MNKIYYDVFAMAVPLEASWWVKGKERIPIGNHISYIESHPETFDLTEEDIYGVDADDLYEMAMKRGWIRFAVHYGYWLISLYDLQKSKRDVIEIIEWAMLDEKMMKPEDKVYIEENFIDIIEPFSAKDYIEVLGSKQEEFKIHYDVFAGVKETSPINSYWIRNGIIYPLSSPHMDFIYDNLKLFGFENKEELKDFEFKTNDLFVELFRKGWIRVVGWVGYDTVYIQFDDFNKRRKSIMEFIEWGFLDKQFLKPELKISLSGFDDMYSEKFLVENYLNVLGSMQFENRIHYDVFAGVIDTVGIEDIIFDLLRYEIEKLPPEATVYSLTSKPGTIFGTGLVFTGEEYSEIEEIKNRLREKFADQYEENEGMKKTIDRFRLMMFSRLHDGGELNKYTDVILGCDLMVYPQNEFINLFRIVIDIASKFWDKGMLRETIVEDLKDRYNVLYRTVSHETVHIIQRMYAVGRGLSYFRPRIKDEEPGPQEKYINTPSEIEAYARSTLEELKGMGIKSMEELRVFLLKSDYYNYVKELASRKNFNVFVNKIYKHVKMYLETLKD